jgi:hypothetical protein
VKKRKREATPYKFNVAVSYGQPELSWSLYTFWDDLMLAMHASVSLDSPFLTVPFILHKTKLFVI